MPSTSAKQAKFMQAIAHNPSFAKKVGVKQAVGKDFEMADKKKESNMKKAVKGKKAKGKNSFAATKFGAAMMKKSDDTKGRAMPKFAKGGSIDGCAQRGKTKTKRVAMKSGGSC